MRISLGVAVSFCALMLLSGCTAGPVTNTIQTSAVQGTTLQGRVHGGQQPIVGAQVYLYAANTTGYGGPGIAPSPSNGSLSLLNSSGNTTQDGNGNYYVTTDSSGNFTITGDYSCPSASSQVYIYSVGGNPGAGANSAAGLLAGLGTCAVPITNSFIFVDEISTIATAYAFAGFASDATHVSSSGTTLALQDIKNAFAVIPNMETLSTGLALATTPAGNGNVPQSEIDSLANVLAACINSTGPSSTQCTTLLGDTMNGSTRPADTATAAINIAHNPGANVSGLFTLQTANPPFVPKMYVAPGDYTIAIDYFGGGLLDVMGLAIDASGNVWLINDGSTNTLSEFSPTGVVLSGSSGISGGGLYGPDCLAIDSSGHVWVGSIGTPTLSVYDATTSSWISGASGYSGGGLAEPRSIAFDSLGNAWVTNFTSNGSISEFSANGSPNPNSPFTGLGLNQPQGIAIDTSNNVWIANYGVNTVVELNSIGAPVSGSPFTGGGIAYPQGIAIDASGDVWTSNFNYMTNKYNLAELSSSGLAMSGSTGYTGGGISGAGVVALDGAGNVWATTSGALSEFSSAGTPMSSANGYAGSWYLSSPHAMAVDGSGNVWAANFYNQNDSTYQIVAQVIGAATPVVTPAVANLMSPYGQHAVNKP